MRKALIALTLASAVASWPAVAHEFCVIPKLVQGIPTTVNVDNINETYCGMALINQKYVNLKEYAKSQVEEPLSCATDGMCSKTLKFYEDSEQKTTPYILVFHGPNLPA